MTNQQQITLGGGCFWCLEAIYQDVIGVEKVQSGYTGGQVKNPSYRAVCTGKTGHAEVTQITFDADVINLNDLFTIFWRIHDPTTLNRQGNDVGTQYRSAIYYHDAEQFALAEASKADAATLYRDPIVTEIVPLEKYYAGEGYHQNYYRSNPNNGYCRAIIRPKVEKFEKKLQGK